MGSFTLPTAHRMVIEALAEEASRFGTWTRFVKCHKLIFHVDTCGMKKVELDHHVTYNSV